MDFLVRSFVGLDVSNTAGPSVGLGVASGVDSGVDSDIASSVGLGIGSSVEVLSRLFIWNFLFLKLLIIFSLALRNNHTLFRKNLFPNGYLPLSIFFE